MGLLFYIALIALVLLGLLFMALVHAGFFYDLRIRISTPLSAPQRTAYKLYRGAYSNAGSGFRELASLVPQLKTFGIYYDDPKTIPQSNLRYIIGCCLTSETPDSEQERILKEAGFSIWTFPKCSRAVITEFPWRSMLSIIVAPKCVYPALRKYFQSNEISQVGPVIEVCETDCIRYIAPLENIEGFFIPELSESSESEERKKDQ